MNAHPARVPEAGTAAWLRHRSGQPPLFGATLAHRYSFNGDTLDSAGGNNGVLLNGASVTSTRLSTGTEHHLVVAVASDGTTSLWVDGTQQINNLATNPLSNVVSTTESIGATAWNDPGHNGTVNEFRIWSGTLSGEEVTRNFGLGPSVVPEPMALSMLALGLLGIFRRRNR